jgi:nifR3 family TIM-barrel protein
MIRIARESNLPAGPWVFPAPMAGVSSIPYRILAQDAGCPVTFAEMVMATPLIQRNDKTLSLLDRSPLETNTWAQIAGYEPEAIGRAAGVVEQMGFKGVDLNCGCSVPKIHRAKCGSWLLQEPDRFARALEAMRDNTSGIPFSVKIRAGWKDRVVLTAEMAKIAEQVGCHHITVHWRFASDGFAGDTTAERLDTIRAAVEAVDMPVIGNGNIVRGEDAVTMIRETGCRGVMVARGSLGNPWIFAEVFAALRGVAAPPRPTIAALGQQIIAHAEGLSAQFGENRGIKIMRKFAAWYTRSLPGAAEYRRTAQQSCTLDELRAVTTEFLIALGDREVPAAVLSAADDCDAADYG